MIKNIFFDLDGTLTDPREGITKSVAYALEYYGIHVEDTDSLCKFIGPPLAGAFEEFYGFSKEKAEEAVWKYRERFSTIGIFENSVYDGIEEMLKRLKKAGFKLVVATSKPTVYSKKILEHFGLSEYFDEVVGSELNGERTDKAEVIEYALKTQNAVRSETIMVGDRKHDIIGAAKNGLKSVGVLFGYGGLKELKEAGADRIAGSVSELEKILLSEGEL